MMFMLERIRDNDAEVLDKIRNELYRYNFSNLPTAAYEPFNYIARDEEEAVVGGLLGHRYGDGVFLDILWIEESRRKQGVGRLLLERLEQEARLSGAKLIHLDTHDFQAPDFYLKQGYEIFGLLEDIPLPGNKRYFLKKVL